MRFSLENENENLEQIFHRDAHSVKSEVGVIKSDNPRFSADYDENETPRARKKLKTNQNRN